MGVDVSLSGRRIDALLVAVGIVLLLGPVWTSAIALGEPLYRYERVEVVPTDDGGLRYAEEPDAVRPVGISDEIACTTKGRRLCSLARYLAAGHTIPSGIQSTDSGGTDCTFQRYCWALVDGQVYRTTYVSNGTTGRTVSVGVTSGDEDSPDENGTETYELYRLDLAVEPGSPREALRDVSPGIDYPDVPAGVAEAARSGTAYSRSELEVPQTPIQVEEDEFYRVYYAGVTDPSGVAALANLLFTYGGPVVGIGLLFRFATSYRIAARVEYADDGDSPRR